MISELGKGEIIRGLSNQHKCSMFKESQEEIEKIVFPRKHQTMEILGTILLLPVTRSEMIKISF